MSISALSVQPVSAHSQAQPAERAPKTAAQTTTQSAAPQDKVTISPQAQQALASNTKPAASGSVDHPSESH